jgi:hypothetical protein
MSAPPVIFASAVVGGPSVIRNLGVDRGNIAKLRTNSLDADTIVVENLIIENSVVIPDGSLQILTAGAGEKLTQHPNGGILTNQNFTLKSLLAGTDVSLTSDVNTVTINASGASAVTLQSAGGAVSLVNDGVGPVLKVVGLDAGTGIALTPVGAPPTQVTIENTSTLSSAGGDSIITDGTAPSYELKGAGNSDFLRNASTATEIRFDNVCVRVRDASGSLPPNADTATAASNGCISIGATSTATGANALCIGAASTAGASNTVVLGSNCSTTGTDGVVIGRNIASTSVGGVAIGANHGALGTESVCIGRSATAAGNNAVVIGDSSTADAASNEAVVLGTDCTVTGAGAIVIGATNVVNSTNAVVIGTQSDVAGTRKIAIGPFIESSGGDSNQIMIGSGADAVNRLVATDDDVFMVGHRVDAASQLSYAAFTPSVAYTMGAFWARWFIAPLAAGDAAPPASDMPGTVYAATFASTNNFTLPPAADFNNLCHSWGLVGGANAPANNVGFTFFISNTTGGQVNLVLGANTTIQDNDGGTTNLGMTDGNVHMFFMCGDGASGYTLRHVGALNRAALL